MTGQQRMQASWLSSRRLIIYNSFFWRWRALYYRANQSLSDGDNSTFERNTFSNRVCV